MFRNLPYSCLYLIAVIIVSTPACQKKLNPNRPEENYIPASVQFEKQLSSVNVPITFPLGELEKQINAAVKGLVYEDNSLENNGNDNFLVKVWKRDSISVNAVNELFNITVPLKIWAKGGLTFNQFGLNISEFRETEFALNVHFVSKIGVNEKWEVYTKTSSNGFDWVNKPVIKIGPVEISLAPVVGNIIDKQQDMIAKMVDKQVKKEIEIKKHVQQAWKTIQKPIKLSNQYNTWLKLTPSEIVMTPLNGKGKTTQAVIGIRGYTETVIGRQPDLSIKEELPPLQTVSQVSDSFNILLSGEVSHEYAEKVIAEQVVNKPFSFQKGKYTVTVTDVDLYGSGEKLVIKAGLVGSVNGTIYLTGVPYYNPASQVLGINQLDFDLDTKNKLAKTASWLAKGRFVKTMEEAFKVPVGKELKETEKLIRQNLQNIPLSKGISLQGELDKLIPEKVYLTPNSLIAVIQATGRAKVKIEGL